MSGNYFAQAEPSQGIFVHRILAKIIRSCFNTTFGITFNFDNLDGSGWFRMVHDGSGWFRMVLDGSGSIWLDLIICERSDKFMEDFRHLLTLINSRNNYKISTVST